MKTFILSLILAVLASANSYAGGGAKPEFTSDFNFKKDKKSDRVVIYATENPLVKKYLRMVKGQETGSTAIKVDFACKKEEFPTIYTTDGRLGVAINFPNKNGITEIEQCQKVEICVNTLEMLPNQNGGTRKQPENIRIYYNTDAEITKVILPERCMKDFK